MLDAIEFDLDDIDALKVERDENDQRKPMTVSERVALANAIAERLHGRHGTNQYQQKGGGNISTSFEDTGKTRDLAAAKAGLGKTLEAAQRVVEHGSPGVLCGDDATESSTFEMAGFLAVTLQNLP